MNRRDKEVIQLQLEAEQDVLHELEKQYKQALNQINQKIRILQSDELTQSKVYQLEYQKALKGQIEGILEKLHGDQYSTIQEYLKNCYTDAFVGTMYSIHGQGIPVMVPIDQNAAVKAIQVDSKISNGLYNSLGVDTKNLKKAIREEVTRGISTGMMYGDIARNIAMVSKAPMSRAKIIVRTEGHRIQQQSADDARTAAKKMGCDVVKQWDSTLDGRTRSNHRKLDGQIRETDELFEVNGKEAMFPGEFGDPAEDCNCRCVALTRAGAALDEDELETLKARAEFFELDKTKDFEEFRGKYLKAEKDIVKNGESAYNSGAISGAYNDDNDPDNEKREAHAKLYYQELKNSNKKAFVSAVSKNASIDSDTVSKAYKHVFEDKHDLDKGYVYFDPDYYMAESFRRLRTNVDIQEHDKIMIRHEALEHDIMQGNPDMPYKEAHEIASKTYDYKKALVAWLKKEGK